MLMMLTLQDTVLFNESIQFNISYGRIGASLADVQEVAALADIHAKVFTPMHPFRSRSTIVNPVNSGYLLTGRV